MPLVVLSAGNEAPLPGSIPGTARRENAELWRQLHRELAEASSRGRLVVAEGSGHMIHHQRPELVVQAVRAAVEMARA